MSEAADRLKLLEGLEAIRPGQDDLDLPELQYVAARIADDPQAAALHQAIQASDLHLSDAFQCVELPTGLEQRLLASLPEAQANSLATQASTPEVQADTSKAQTPDATVSDAATPLSVEACEPVSPRGKQSRRLLAGFSLTAACLTLLMAAGLAYQWTLQPPLQVDEIVASALRLRETVDLAWNDNLQSVPASHPVSLRMQQAPVGWAATTGLGDKRAIAYRFKSRTAGATLFVFHGTKTVDHLPAAPPARPQHASGAAVGAWVVDDLLYVLVVDGTVRDYQRFVRTAAGLAMLQRPQRLPKWHDEQQRAA